MAVAKATLQSLAARIAAAHASNPFEPVRPPLRADHDDAVLRDASTSAPATRPGAVPAARSAAGSGAVRNAALRGSTAV